MDNTKVDRKYKTIGEVAKVLDLYNKKTGSFSTYTIRFWEKEFKQIKPKVFNGNRRYYDEETIIILKKIKFLLKVKGMTLNGVKKLLNSGDSDIDDLYNISINRKYLIKSKINKIKKILISIKEPNG
mgnify:CR=1 FL=1|tara:strand:+ start:2459 stop:2839 length:381 start_codon:yes stop_codon:yes gene_type:complete